MNTTKVLSLLTIGLASLGQAQSQKTFNPLKQ